MRRKRELRAAVEADPNAMGLLQLRLASVLLQAGKVEPALTVLHGALALDPQSSEVHALVAKGLLRKSENASALLEAKAAVSADPKNPDAWMSQGAVHQALGDGREAKECFSTKPWR